MSNKNITLIESYFKIHSDLINFARIEKMMTPKITKPYYVYSGDMAEEQYATCIQKLVEVLTESYRVLNFPCSNILKIVNYIKYILHYKLKYVYQCKMYFLR